jgi:ABC-2 type transport system permease protein
VGAALLAVTIVVCAAGASFLVAAAVAGLDLPWGRAVGAVVLLLPLAAAVLAFGYAVSAWRPEAVGAVTGAIVAVSFFSYVLAPLFGLPHVVRDLSVFELYGVPLIDGVDWTRVVTLCVAALTLIALGTIAFQRKDIAK